jgi:hypothetical protein
MSYSLIVGMSLEATLDGELEQYEDVRRPSTDSSREAYGLDDYDTPIIPRMRNSSEHHSLASRSSTLSNATVKAFHPKPFILNQNTPGTPKMGTTKARSPSMSSFAEVDEE